MVFPLYDDNTGRRLFPFVNYAFIALNVFVFLVLQEAGDPNNHFTYAYSVVPKEILTGHDVQDRLVVVHPVTGEKVGQIDLQPTPFSVYLTLLTSMFMHGGWGHLLGNMLFLWIFGDNVEDYLGHLRYLLFYLVCGILAGLIHVFVSYAFQSDLLIPCLGASGAISGVLGGYILLYPHRRVTVILFRFLTEVPAWVAIGIWFAFQLLNGLGTLGDRSGGGVAYGAHIGGFVVGLVLVKVFAVGVEPESYSRTPPSRMYRR